MMQILKKPKKKATLAKITRLTKENVLTKEINGVLREMSVCSSVVCKSMNASPRCIVMMCRHQSYNVARLRENAASLCASAVRIKRRGIEEARPSGEILCQK